MLDEWLDSSAWTITHRGDLGGSWIGAQPISAEVPAQGWKLHVSATIATAHHVLTAALPVLREEQAAFKVAASPAALAYLNEGSGGRSQVGKFITVYPRDDAQAVRLAAALDAATRGFVGPAVPSDRQLRLRSAVSYRYGGFSTALMQTALGEVVPLLTTADGRLIPDRRYAVYVPPEGVVDPFEASGLVERPARPNLLIAGRYALIAVLQQSPRGAVSLAADIAASRRVVLKRARRGAAVSTTGIDACGRLREEAAVLAALAPHPGVVAAYGLVEHGDDLYLVLEDVDGRTFEEHVFELRRRGCQLPVEQVIAWGRELAGTLAHVHARGYAYRDLKSPNVLIDRDGRLRLIDFDLTQPLVAGEPPSGKGTRGYASPQQFGGGPASVSDDVYGLGAVLYFLATGVEPSWAPDQFHLTARPLEVLHPRIQPALAHLIERCLAPDPVDRFSSMVALEQALAQIVAKAANPYEAPFGRDRDQRRAARTKADLLAETICAEAQPAPGSEGFAWASSHPSATGGIRTRDLNAGSAGTLLALAELADELGTGRYREIVAQASRWLAVAPPFLGEPLPGLYVGEAGIGAALLRAGQVLGDRALIEAACARGRYVASLPYASPDLFNGTAGRLRFHLWLWDETGAAEHLDAARAAVGVVLDGAKTVGDDGVRWVIPDGYASLSGTAPLDYAHGAAGIADALLDFYEASGDARVREVAVGTALWLYGLAVPALDDGSGLHWPSTDDEEPFVPWWCHGATGIGRFFLHAAALDLIPDAFSLTIGAARATAHGARALAASLCHGLAGGIEFLIDVYQATGDRVWLREARTLARLLEAFAAKRNGRLVYAAEKPGVFTPDYMVGYAGVAVCLLRLADPERRPHQLSRAGFRFRAGPELRGSRRR
jgi:hypothetical protein